MTSLNARDPVRPRPRWLPIVACATLALSACGGGSGGAGQSGSAATTGQTPASGGSLGSTKLINASVRQVTMSADGRPVVQVWLADETGRALTGVPASSVAFVLARLEPAVNWTPSTWHAITRRTEAFPGTPAPSPADKVTGTGPVNQGYTEPATAGQWVESSQQNGSYTYTFAQSLKGVSDIPYNGSLVHRVGLEVRSSTATVASNGVYTWIPATGDTAAQSGREIVDNATCNACHQKLSAHGGARVDLQYCVMCHESYSFDAQSGNSIDFKVMIHKIHSGKTLPSVVAGGFYGIFGYGNTFSDFSGVAYPQDTRNCQTCHRESDPATPQASNWRLVVSRQACSSCHDNINFATGANHGGGVAATDDMCVTCHGPSSTLNNGGLRPEIAHLIPEQEAAKKFKFEVVKVEAIKADGTPGATGCATATAGCTVRPGEFAKVTIRVSDPTTGALYKITDPAFANAIPCTPVPPATTCSPTPARLRVRVAYTTLNYTNRASGNYPAQPIQIDFLSSSSPPSGAPPAAGGLPTLNADGTYTKAAGAPIPSGLFGGTGEAFLEGRTIVDVSSNPAVHTYVEAGPTSSAGVIYPITDATAVARRAIVDVAKCDRCHFRLSFHGANRNDNTELCATCHNPENASGTTLANGIAYDFKFMIHAIHASTFTYPGVNPVGYPGVLNNCEGCHKPGTYYPVDSTKVFATSVTSGSNPNTPTDDIAWSPNAAVCTSCHTSSDTKQHVIDLGGSFNVTKGADGQSSGYETCGGCHGAGQLQDVKVVHNVAAYQSN